MPPKRKSVDLHEDAVSVDLREGWMEKLLALDKDNLASILVDLANKGDISNSTFEGVRTTLPSFSAPNWVDFAEQFGLPSDFESLALEHFVTPSYPLPPSFHGAIIENSWGTQDVYRERRMQTTEEARVRMLDPVSQQ